MKSNTLTVSVIQQKQDKVFLAFVNDYPAICAQADSVDEVIAKIKRFAKLYFGYKSNQDVSDELMNAII